MASPSDSLLRPMACSSTEAALHEAGLASALDLQLAFVGDGIRTVFEAAPSLVDEQPFLEENISLQEVAARLNVPPHHVSMVINAELGLNFYSFINRYRLEEVTRMLSDPDLAEENVLNIAFRAGFQSKAAFNRVFKQHTRLSPREFRARALD